MWAVRSLTNKLYPSGSLLIPNIKDESWVEGIEMLETYKQRILTIVNSDDYAIMPESIRDDNDFLREIYNDLGVPFVNKENILYIDYNWSLTASILEEHKEIMKFIGGRTDNIVPFINSSRIDSISKALDMNVTRTAESSDIINDKSIAQRELKELGVSTPVWKTVFSFKEAKKFFIELRSLWYATVAFKLRRAASGMGVFKISTEEELESKIFEHRDQMQEVWILLDGWIEGEFVSSPNIQYYIGKNPSEDIFIWSSTQILEDGKGHLWNITDTDLLKNEKLSKDLRIIRNWIRSKKAYGISGIDFSLYRDSSLTKDCSIKEEIEPYFMEINGRVNGSTHGAVLASKIYGSDYADKWAIANNIHLPNNMTINEFIFKLQKDGIFFDQSTSKGVIPTNIAAIDKYSKAMIAVFWEKDYIKEVMNTLASYDQ